MAIEPTSPGPGRVLTPSTLNRIVRGLIEDALPVVWIEGEISNFVRAASGHWYFSLKDTAAEVRCAMFTRANARLAFRPENGQQVLARARVSLYEPRGSYQLILEHMEDAGEGALRRAFEQLKARLEAEGLFDRSRKRTLPAYPRRVAVITSSAGAAIRDVLSVARRRFALTEIEVLAVPVQGTEAPPRIAAMLRAASDCGRYDALLVTRGGGSLEDLAAFNDEGIARAIAAAAVPVVSAVGHETDFSISDFVADLRAPTPSAAAEILFPDGTALLRTLEQTRARLERECRARAQAAMQRLDQLAGRLHVQRPAQRLVRGHERMLLVRQRLMRASGMVRERASASLARTHMRLLARQPGARLERAAQAHADLYRRLLASCSRDEDARRRRLTELARALHAVSPLSVLKRGYAILLDDTGRTVRSVHAATPGAHVHARLADGELPLRVDDPGPK